MLDSLLIQFSTSTTG